MAENQVDQSISLSVQTDRNAYYMQTITGYDSPYGLYSITLPSVYNPYRQRMLKTIAQHPQNTLWQGAVAKIAHKVGGTSAEISGKYRLSYFQDLIFFDSDKGEGFQSFIDKVLNDYLTCDDGAVIELIGRGDPTTPLDREAIVGISVLDPLRCYFTNNHEYPVFYQDAFTGELHKLHATRVVRLVDQPSSNPDLAGRGFCALSRAIGAVQQAIVNQTYIGEALGNQQPPGILLVNGAIPKKWDEAWAAYKNQIKEQGLQQYAPVVTYVSQGEQVTIEFIPFASAPPNYDPIKIVELEARMIALGLDTDPQDVFPITGGSLGVNTQSKILDEKNRDGGFTHLLKVFERFFNERVLPVYLRFQWKYRNDQQSALVAQNALTHMQVASQIVQLATSAGGSVNTAKLMEIAFRYLADNVESLQTILTSEDGEIIRLYDDDQALETPSPVLTGTVNEPTSDTPEVAVATDTIETKDFEDTRMDFVSEMFSVLSEQNTGGVAPRRSSTLLRSIVSKYRRKAMIDGLEDNGVSVEALSGDDLNTLTLRISEDGGYISDLVQRVKGGLSDKQLRATVDSWANKSIRQSYQDGLISANKNKMMRWKLGNTERHCSDCKRLAGQVHRLKDWADHYMPGSNKLECGGHHCDCDLEDATGQRAKGKY